MRSVRTLATAWAVLLCGVASAAAQQTIFLVRHAERADAAPAGGAAMVTPATDPPLSTAGHARSARLAVMLRSADIRHIFTTEFLRTRQTAAPAAQAMKLEITAVSSKDPSGLVARMTEAPGNMLVVGHSNTLPDILKRLGLKETVTLADDEYDNLFIVVRPATGEPTLIRLRY
jgi:phosphohistidine phosphatase SixA